MRKLSRRDAIAVALTCPVAAPVVARAAKRRLRIAGRLDGPGNGGATVRFAQRITALSAGSLVLEVKGEPLPPDPAEVVAALRRGEIDLLHGADLDWPDPADGSTIFASVPFGLTATEHVAWMQFGGGQELWDTLSATRGLKHLICGNTGARMGGWYDRPIRKAEDLCGLRIRISGPGAQILRGLGAEPVSMPLAEVSGALAAGTLNAVAWGGPNDDLDLGVQKLLPYYMYPGFHQPGHVIPLAMTVERWRGLSPGARAIIETAATAEAQRCVAQNMAEGGRALALLREEYGTMVMPFPDALLEQAALLSRNWIRQVAGGDDLSARTVESFLSLRSALTGPARAMTASYISARPDPPPSLDIAPVHTAQEIRD